MLRNSKTCDNRDISNDSTFLIWLDGPFNIERNYLENTTGNIMFAYKERLFFYKIFRWFITIYNFLEWNHLQE